MVEFTASRVAPPTTLKKKGRMALPDKLEPSRNSDPPDSTWNPGLP